MRALYTRGPGGRVVKTADIYTADEHRINRRDVDHDAVKIIRRLQRFEYDAFVVGGAVRDLLIGKHPKDFDIATSATPAQIRKLFRNSRVIGKRFRLVHILFRDKIIEVSTFRSESSEGFKNEYGTIEEDVMRRDFSANALYFDPVKNTVVDYVDGVRDIRKHVLRPIISLDRIFREDPVRMVRAIKYAVLGGMKLPRRLRRRLQRDASLLETVPSSRMTEELFKILHSGHSLDIVRELVRFGVFSAFLPNLTPYFDNGRYTNALYQRLGELDDMQQGEAPAAERSTLLAALLADYLLLFSDLAYRKRVPARDAYFASKEILSPITPANREIEDAVAILFKRKKALLAGTPLFSARNRT